MGAREQSRAREANTCSVLVCFAFVLFIAAVLFPVFCPHGHSSLNSDCQSNMSQIGRGLKIYLSEWHDMYPSNRTWTGKGKLGPISCYVKLTPPGRVDKDGHPKRYQYGVNWVESLYPYVEAISGGSSGAWACQTVTKGKTPDTSSTARVSYVMNRNLIERPESVIRSASSLMLVREMDRLVDAELRPTNDSSRNPKLPPIEPFLTNSDSRIGDTNGRIHGAGSNILFADGHVKGFFDSYYPGQRNITKSKCWDSVDKAWYNFSSTAHAIPEAMKRSIAVTP